MDRLTETADIGELMTMLEARDGAVRGDDDAQYGLIVIGIVGLRIINSEFGWPIGNAVLRSLATRLMTMPSSTCVARVDSDKFAVLIDNVDREDVREIGGRLKQRLNATPWEIDGISVPVRVRTTFAIGPAPSDTPEMNVLWAALRINRMKQIRDLKEQVVNLESQLRLREAQVDVGVFRGQLAIAIAHHDELTRVFNRDGYDAVLPTLDPPFTLAFFDIDNLRELNKIAPLYWKAGDLALVMIALFVKDLSPDVVLVRWGGDEVLGLFRGQSPDEVRRNVERASDAAKEQLVVEGHHVTLSGGLSYVMSLDDYDNAFQLAQEATRAAKDNGRSQFIVAASN